MRINALLLSHAQLPTTQGCRHPLYGYPAFKFGKECIGAASGNTQVPSNAFNEKSKIT